MDETFVNQMRKAWHEAQREGQATTHWLLTFATLDHVKYEVRDSSAYDAQLPQSMFMGLPIYLTSEMDPPGFLLREGEPPDELREQELRRQLRVIQRKYQDQTRPIVDELAKLEARMAAAPKFFPSRLGGGKAPR